MHWFVEYYCEWIASHIVGRYGFESYGISTMQDTQVWMNE